MRASEPTTQAMCSIRNHHIQHVISLFEMKSSLAMKKLSNLKAFLLDLHSG